MKSFYKPLLLACLISLMPLIAMQFTKEVNWSFFDFDFALAFVLLSLLFYSILFLIKRFKKPSQKIFSVGVLLFFLLFCA